MWLGGTEVDNDKGTDRRSDDGGDKEEKNDKDLKAALEWKRSFYGSEGLLSKEEWQEAEKQASFKVAAQSSEGKDE